MNIQKEIEIKVGLFVVAGLTFIMLATILLGGGGGFFTRTVKYSAHFENAEGLISGAKVIFSGINVGTVERVELDKNLGNVAVELVVLKDVQNWIKKDATVEISTQGVLGDKFISISAGSVDAQLLPAGSDIPPRQGKDFSQFLTKGDQLLITLNRIASNLDHIFASFETDKRSDTFFKNMAISSKNLSLASEKLNQQLNDPNLPNSIAHLNQILEKIDNGTGTVGALINDPSIYDQMKSLLGGANRNRIIRNLVRKTLQNSQGDSGNTSTEHPESK